MPISLSQIYSMSNKQQILANQSSFPTSPAYLQKLENRARWRQKQLINRLKVLKKYQTIGGIQSIKIKIEQFDGLTQQPLLQVALTCGFRNDRNEVLSDIVARHYDRARQINNPEQLNEFLKILNMQSNRNKWSLRQPISYIDYKQANYAKQKFIGLIKPSLPKERKRMKSISTSEVRSNRKSSGLPKELKELKKRLVTLPAVRRVERRSLPSLTENIEINKDKEQGSYYSDELDQLATIFREEQIIDEKQDQEEAIAHEKKGIMARYQYKLNVQRDTFRRNVKSYQKCIQNYRTERKREEVRANGIKRLKKISMLEKIKNLMAEEAESRQRAILQSF